MKKASLISIVLAVTISLACFGMLNLYGNTGPLAHITVYGAGIPDALGNRIYGFGVYQNTTGTFTSITSVLYTSFTNGTTLSIPANQHTILTTTVWLNYSLATDLPTASARARINITVAGVYASSLMLYRTGLAYPSPPFTSWMMYYDYPALQSSPTSTWIPATDTTYTVTVQYQAYY